MSHLTQVKRIINYISGTSDNGLLYSFDANSFMVGYSDVDWRVILRLGKSPLVNV